MKNYFKKILYGAMFVSCILGTVACGDTGNGGPGGNGGINATPGTFKFEFEECEMTDGVEPLQIETTNRASNQACVAYFRDGAILKFTIDSTHAEDDVKFVLCASSTVEYRDPVTNELTGVRGIKAEVIGQMCYANGAPVTGWTGEFYGSGGGDTMGAFPERDWYNFSTVQTTVDLQKGQNIIEFRGSNVRLNWDYIELTTKTTELSMEVIDDEGGSIGGW